mgnify:CR=1 FL=1
MWAILDKSEFPNIYVKFITHLINNLLYKFDIIVQNVQVENTINITIEQKIIANHKNYYCFQLLATYATYS